MNARREIGYDFIRFIAMVLIVVFHFYTTCAEKGYRFPLIIKQIIVHGIIGWGRGRRCPVLYAVRRSFNDDKQ